MRIIYLCGSLRKNSYNRKLMETMMSEAPSHWEMAEVELKDIPFYDADIESAGEPEAVKRLKAAIADADGIIMVTPEYNNGMPAILKNAIDWASSPPDSSPLPNKAVALAGASPQGAGTVQAQAQLRQVLGAIQTRTMPGPKILVGQIQNRVAEEDRLIKEESTVKRIKAFVGAFDEWVRFFQK
ncbi:NADPH:quinone oxidoreductase [Bacillus sp. JCM 19046]|nr:NADPH:quinone oxidoreductase [Bacillus sp. JCM 19045]GAF15801.1 NADPH:quinone oxidoreductase [Bacillus sp. JCM 19046]